MSSIASDSRPIWVSVWYRDQHRAFEHDTAEGALTIGRRFLRRLFQTNGTTFRNISRRHLQIAYDSDKDQVWASDSSLLGTLARVLGDGAHDNAGPEFLYHHEQFLVKRKMQLRLQNEDEEREPDDVIIQLENEGHEETRPIVSAPAYWDRLLTQLRSVRAGHLVGLAGMGKTTLAKKLLAPDGTLWQRQRDRHLGGTALVAWVDCHLMQSQPLWQQLGRRMLTALHTAADERGLIELREELRDSVDYFDRNVLTRIGQMNSVFRSALRAVVKAGLRPLIVLDHFDAGFAQIDPFMLYQLYQFHQWPEIGEELRYLILTRKPLELLRNDIDADGVNEFASLFGRTTIQLTPVFEDDFRQLWREVAPEYGFISADVLRELFALSGGYPALVRELYQELAINNWLSTAPETWGSQLRQQNWANRPPQSLTTLWQSLDEAEQHTVNAALNDEPSDKQIELRLRSDGLFTQRGALVSPLMRHVLPTTKQRLPAEGLHIDAERQRVFVDGEDITGKLSGRKLDVLLYLHAQAGRLCTYQELIEETIPADVSLNDLSIDMERSALQRAVSRLCRIVDPTREYISNEQGRGYLMRVKQTA